ESDGHARGCGGDQRRSGAAPGRYAAGDDRSGDCCRSRPGSRIADRIRQQVRSELTCLHWSIEEGIRVSTFRDVDPAVTGKLTCGSLRGANAGEIVGLRGWVNRRRGLGGLIVIDLRDRYGLAQIAFNPEIQPDAHAMASEVRNEYVLEATGIVRERPEGTKNPRLATGEIEIEVQSLTVLNTSLNPPFYINEESDVDES